MSEVLPVGLLQMTSGPTVADNLAAIERGLSEAAERGLRLIVLPENAHIMAPEAERIAAAEPLEGPFVSSIRDLARARRVGVLLGSFAERSPDPGKTWNTSVFIDASGEVLATYRKIHLFDVRVSADTTYCESATVLAGEPAPVVLDFEGWRFGLTICYDLRFPELYRALSAAGAEVLAVPAAFTVRTGSAHWHLLLRARAVENFAYVLAPGQCGRNFGARETWGHSLAVAPWGEVIAERDADPGLIAVELRKDRVRQCREMIPALTHRRLGL